MSMMRLALRVVVVASFLVSCRESGEPPLVAEEILQLNSEANQVVFGLEHYVTTGGIRRALVEADTAFFLEGRSLVELRTLRVTFFNANGEETSVLTSREGTYDWESGDMTATTDVVVVNRAEGRRIETSVLHYSRYEDRIWSDEYTTMTEADGTVVEGTAFDSDSRMERIDLTSPRLTRPGVERSSEP